MGKGRKDPVWGNFDSPVHDEAPGFSLELQIAAGKPFCGTGYQALPARFLNELPRVAYTESLS